MTNIFPYWIIKLMKKLSAYFVGTQYKQSGSPRFRFRFGEAGVISPVIIVIGVVIVIIIVISIASGAFKFSGSVSKNNDQSSVEQPNVAVKEVSVSKNKTYTNSASGINLEYPEAWNIKEGVGGFVASFHSPQAGSNDSYTEYLGFKVIDTSSKPEYTVATIADLWESQTKKETKGDAAFTVTDRKSSTVAGNEAKDIEYTFKFDDLALKGLTRVTLVNGKAYIFQYYAAEGDYNKYLPDVESILSSVKL
ncbi:MAG: PsbP-related protein [Candidatus Daviesbacteria bacterium]|nr:PsbP-related protein [Candidatus Daviesbacteria bacterium]